MNRFQAPPGTRDVLAPESARFAALVGCFAHQVGLAGYGLVINPMFEDAGVFRRGVGEASEVVTKEMYVFEDKGGRTLALRPEGTASVVRAFVQHRPQIPWKAWYATPAFRYERQQAGRYRQHHQLGVEVLGSDDPDIDVEVIALLDGFLRSLGLTGLELRLNSLGDGNCRPAHLVQLSEYLASNEDRLCDEHRATWRANPLRVLDCKRESCRAVRDGAPKLRAALCVDCQLHLERVIAGLGALQIDYVWDDYLVRGLDYYTRTTFEVTSTRLEAAQNGIGGGGRYDGLAEALGGPAAPGIGFGSGIERILLACAEEGLLADVSSGVEVFVADSTGGEAARDLTHQLRQAGIATDRAFGGHSLKSQMKQADRSGAMLALIVGTDEDDATEYVLRVLRGPDARTQERIEQADVIERVGRRLQ